jgi:hypothetical protein
MRVLITSKPSHYHQNVERIRFGCQAGILPARQFGRIFIRPPPGSRSLPRLAKLRNLSHGCVVQFPTTEITDALLASYSRHGGINHLDGINLPSKASVADITRDLLRLVFPGFFDEHIIHRGAAEGSALTFDTLELGNGAPFGTVPKGPATSLLEVREVPNAPIRIIWHQFGLIDV